MKKTILRILSLSVALVMLAAFFASCDEEKILPKASNITEAKKLYEDAGYTITDTIEGSAAASVATQLGFNNLTSAIAATKTNITPDEELKTLKSKIYTVEITVKDFGTMKLDLYEALAPKSVGAFVGYAKDGFYDGLKFHRIIDGFMIQGGDPNGTGAGDSSLEKIYGEFAENGWYRNMNLKFTEGVIGMARSKDNNSGSSQFFICLEDYNYGDGKYASFGKMTEGFETLHAIGKVPVTGAENSTPVDDVIMESVKVISEREEILDSSLTDNIGPITRDSVFVFYFKDEDSAKGALAQAESLYAGDAGSVYTSDIEVTCIGNVIIAGTISAIEIMK